MSPPPPKRGRGRPPKGEGDGDASSREQLMAAAATVFAQRGYHGASVDAIVKEAGLSKGTFYWNFSSKDELFLALLDERFDKPLRGILAAVRDVPPGGIDDVPIGAAFAAVLRDQRGLMILALEQWLAALRDDELGAAQRERMGLLRETIADVVRRRHEITQMEPVVPIDDLALMYSALGLGSTMLEVLEPGVLPEHFFPQIADLIYDGLAARAASRAAGEPEREPGA
jgi:AcrR family transcriptional regulator